jgi:hypothetical protein
MAERLVSPGVFTRENDLSFLPQGIAQIGAAFIGPTVKGPAFRPIIVESQEEFAAWYGATSTDFYTPYAVRAYLKESSRATVVRVLGLTGYDPTAVKSARLTISGSDGEVTVGYLHPSRTGVTIHSVTVGGAALSGEFSLTISGTNGSNTFTSMSVDPDSPSYFVKVLGSGPTTNKDAYAYAAFPKAIDFFAAGTGSITVYENTGATALNLSGSTFGSYRNARTPMIKSQLIGGQSFDLFKIYTLGDGDVSNTDVKISIAGLRQGTTSGSYGSFSILVREFSDTDALPTVLEQFDGLSLDPTSDNYFAKRVGTARTVVENDGDVYLEGDYPNQSRYIYIDPVDGMEDVPPSALPMGFDPMAAPVAVSNSIPAPSYVVTRYYTPTGATTAVANNKLYYGFDYSDPTSLSWLRPIPENSIDSTFTTEAIVGIHATSSAELAAGGPDVGFDFETILSSSDSDALLAAGATGLSYRKFTVPMQGGFNGENPAVVRNVGASIAADNTMGFDLSDASTDGTTAYVQAINAVSNPDAYDVNVIVAPGVIYSLHSYVAQQIIDLCETRGDAFYIMDPEALGATYSDVVNTVQSLDTN